MTRSKIGKNKYLIQLHNQFTSNMIMNWSSLHKCILVLALTLAVHLLWIIWKLFIIFNPNLWQWVNLPLIQSQVYVNTGSAILISLLILFCIVFQKKSWVNIVLPYFIINLFIIVFIADGFLVGIYSPATIFAFVCISGLGIILFDRKFIYSQLFIAIAIYLAFMFCTYNNIVAYAPIFSAQLLDHHPYKNPFWILSMVYFIVPILFVCLFLCEILLSQWRRRESLIKNLSQTDPLTNLYNRRFFNEKLHFIQKMKTDYVIILMDVDHFKRINDFHGHQFGDEALIRVAELLSTQVRNTDIVARYGGEEFIIALPETSLSMAYEIAERCRLAIQNQIIETFEQENVQLTASFGLAISIYSSNIDKVIDCADQALYRAKQLGRNQVQLYTDQMPSPELFD